MSARTLRRVGGLIALVGLGAAAPAPGLPAPSKTAAGQSAAEREADVAIVLSVLEQEEVMAGLAAHGFSAEEVHLRLAQLSPEELDGLAGQLQQMQAAGLQPPSYIWILLGVFLGVLILATLF